MEAFFRDDVGRMEEGWGTLGGVRWVSEAARGRAWPCAQGWGGGGGAQHWGSHGPLPAPQLLFIPNSWHIMGIQALGVLQAGHGDQVGPARVPGATRKPVSTSLGGRMSRFRKATSKMKDARVVKQGVIFSKQSVG